MGKGNQKWTEELIRQRERAGYGSGDGTDYKPWITVHDVPSSGRTHRTWSPIYGRTVHLLSDVEWRTFILLEFSRKYPLLYEGFPLERKATLEIAVALGIRHPHYPGTHVPTVMTVDFLAVESFGDEMKLTAFDCKRSEDAEDERAIEKLQITRAYFAGRGVPHHLVFHTLLPEQAARNVEWIRSASLKEGEIEPYDGYLNEKADQMFHELSTGTFTLSLRDFCTSFEARHNMGRGDGLRVARILMWEHRLRCGMRLPNIPNAPLNSFVCSNEPQERFAIG